ncbi:MAG: hypothetical protein M1821_009556 [Bathelium mastoideum]|nr:MAG: hypothetical protein M1821_009556 [Bathelium mastoideum]KAI9688779.1 MAG: hypothetical protein M1822_001136 [Bathelium mastoideum]
MAVFNPKRRNSSSNSIPSAQIRATCYTGEWGGGFEVLTSAPSITATCLDSPYTSSDEGDDYPEKLLPSGLGLGRATKVVKGVGYTVAEECERLFCETMRIVFLGDSQANARGSLLAAGMRVKRNDNDWQVPRRIDGYEERTDPGTSYKRNIQQQKLETSGRLVDLGSSVLYGVGARSLVSEWVEFYDYMGDVSCRGVITNDDSEGKTLMIFLDQSEARKELKHCLVALLDLCDDDNFGYSRLVIAIDRSIGVSKCRSLVKSLGWVSFRPITLRIWAGEDFVSDKWLLLGQDMDV